ncbi:Uncharacterised protein [Streptococcus pneumoniae]|nr:Uncharacterised protein [Streptococcus pneumoniae]CMY77119.1 Uncharacterised protein [Streptococcus pneumoniae]CNA24640.1 Uncharacterised protein [Streptococcus pneumoniae]VJA27133.1 Uncharacterised protein [Streptococcus pneumoniae]VLS25598.1 Uncharacterised protein [Streptococcus pneumoniae]
MFWICKAFDVVDIAVKEGFQVAIACLNKDGDRFAWCYIYFRTRITNGTDQVFETFHTSVGSKVLKGWVDSWVCCCHDRAFSVLTKDFFCHEWHDWVKKTEDFIQRIEENRSSNDLIVFIVAVKNFLGQLNIPVGKFFPNEVVEDVASNTKLKLIKVSSCFSNRFIEVVENPAVRHITSLTCCNFCDIVMHHIQRQTFIVHKDVARDVPDLVNEVP